MKHRWSSLLAGAALGLLMGGSVTYVVQDSIWSHDSLVKNTEYKACLAHLSTRTLARLRSETPEDAIPFLEEHVDRYLVTVPMGRKYEDLTWWCQNALACGKVYRSRYPSSKELNDEFHLSEFLADVPTLPADHDWLDIPLRKIAAAPPAN